MARASLRVHNAVGLHAVLKIADAGLWWIRNIRRTASTLVVTEYKLHTVGLASWVWSR